MDWYLVDEADEPGEKFGYGCFELGAHGAVDEEVAGCVDDEQAVVKGGEAEEPYRRSEF